MKDKLPWGSITAALLEELLFSLVHHMGAVEVEWRSSAQGITTSDGGRDIEAIFEQVTPDGDVKREKWWIDAKRRNGTVRPGDVKDVVNNSAAESDLACVIIATNGSFSNQTHDWLKQYCIKNPYPVIKLWDGRKLQALVDAHPAAAAETLVAALEFDQRIEFLSSYFTESGRVLSPSDLDYAWENRARIKSGLFIVQAAYSDFGGLNYHERPWAALLDGSMAAEALIHAHTSLVSCAAHWDTLSIERACNVAAYITAQACCLLPSDLVARILVDPYHFLVGKSESPSIEAFVKPVLFRILAELADACGSDCARIDISPPLAIQGSEVDHYWKRFERPADNGDEGENDARSLIIINSKIPCAVGFELPSSVSCPLLADDIVHIEDVVRTIDRVIEFRKMNPDGQFRKFGRVILEDPRAAEIVNDVVGDLLPEWNEK
ncbi:restriction endonuclease [Lentzea aerocolonigenes]|uniref:restriction endonuclease n=1 Tax=Lentzea aerocolonigenes TaxID=68170 RepID=UPI0012E12477|nr:restriction endonuclease [Lentzea aerocolonigenes]